MAELEVAFPALESVGSDYVVTGAFESLVIRHDGAMTVEGMVRINDVAVRELDLPGVDTVKKDFSIDSNSKLETLQVDGLTTVEKSLSIQENGKLKGVSFAELRSVKGDVTIYQNAALTDFELVSLEFASTISFTLNGNDPIVSFPALSSLGSRNTTSTSSFKGIREIYFSSLAKVNGALSFQSTLLEDLTIPLLKTLNGSITVESNPSLTTLALPRVSDVGDIFIDKNDALTNITANGLKVVGTVDIKASGLENMEFFGLEEVKGDFEVRGADTMDCSWFDDNVKSITRGKYVCKGDHDPKDSKSSTGGIENTEGNPDDYMKPKVDGEEEEEEGESEQPTRPNDSSTINSTEDAEESGGGLSTGAVAGIGIGIALFAGLLALGVIFWFLQKRRRKHIRITTVVDESIKTTTIQESRSEDSILISSHTPSSRDGKSDNMFDDGQMLGVHTKIEANIHVDSVSSMSNNSNTRGGFFSAVFYSASDRAFEIGFRVMNVVTTVRDGFRRRS